MAPLGLAWRRGVGLSITTSTVALCFVEPGREGMTGRLTKSASALAEKDACGDGSHTALS